MINTEKISAHTWNSHKGIDDIIDYLNTLELSDEAYNKLEEMFDGLINDYSGAKERACGEDT